jgi:hypothetical protein
VCVVGGRVRSYYEVEAGKVLLLRLGVNEPRVDAQTMQVSKPTKKQKPSSSSQQGKEDLITHLRGVIVVVTFQLLLASLLSSGRRIDLLST